MEYTSDKIEREMERYISRKAALLDVSSGTTSFVTTIPVNVRYRTSYNKIANERALRSFWIRKDPKVCNNKPIIFGTRISVVNIVELHRVLGWDIEKIKEEYPFLNEEQIIAALEYYESNPKEIEDYLKEEKEVENYKNE